MARHASQKKTKILVVEDDRLFSEIYAAKFAEEGFEVSLATDGDTGLRKIIEEKPDVALFDIVLPKMTGIELLERVRKDERPEVRKLPVIVVTNLNQESYVNRMKDLGAKAYFLKSDVIFSVVLARVREILDEAAK